MDIVLDLFDEYLLDAAWARIVPLDAFGGVPALSKAAANASSFVPYVAPSSTWNQFVSYLPHPPLPHLNATVPAAHAISAWPRDYIPRQLLSLSAITLAGIYVLYFSFAWLSYTFIFNHEMMKHPRFLKNQVKLEIQSSLRAFPGITLLTLPWFEAEVRGHSKLYSDVSEYGIAYLIFSVPFFLLFTDYAIYWVHRLLHHPLVYKHIHKPHHKWLVPTPFASHAFHFVDGYLQSVPYHLFIFLFPLQRWLYLGLFVFVNCWSILVRPPLSLLPYFGCDT
ncbi:hypothetical protein DENSPDRAFT_832318 [Dentipellis sp. KUC8613]|nr:hypothetical protein DENSPDRAFT_832318 [Dentipellis sp. KUC8613]